MSIPFEAFFEAVWGYPPYPWQAELSRIVREEGWPAVLDLPTGSGKTAVLDIALHHLMKTGGEGAPRRIIMVVDRRVIVDQVGLRAVRLLEALRDADRARSGEKTAVLGEARDALQRIVGHDAPLLHTEVMRGGVPRGDAWAAYPHVPVLAGSTVDQVGSRLFFRGYGVSDRMRPVHAGLLGCDTLLLLDEVHLARPFAEVLGQLARLREREGERNGAVSQGLQVVQLSATPGKSMLEGGVQNARGDDGPSDVDGTGQEGDGGRRRVFQLSEADRADPRLARILNAPKPAVLELVEVKARSMEGVKRRAMAERAAKHAREMVGEGRKAVAVIVNRVDTARRVWTLLQNAAFDTVLITGRMRPFDQASMIARIEARVMAGRAAQPDARPIVVVATQTIEAGADYDFDGLVTECASLDALRQRFGRLDRLGDYPQRALGGAVGTARQLEAFGENRYPSAGAGTGLGPTARAVILMRSDYLGSVLDPVYGKALPETWTWLVEVSDDGLVDFGIAAIEPYIDAAGDRLENMIAPSRPAPVLLPAYLDQWAQTNPKPHADPDVSLFLHGIPEDARSALPDVRVVWRSDITEEDLATAVQTTAPEKLTGSGENLIEHLAMVPPGSLEAISLPIWTVKQWLSDSDNRQNDDIADVEGVPQPADEAIPRGRSSLIWRGSKRSEISGAAAIAPGDTIVVPAGYGGIGEHGTFDPAAVPAADAPLGTRPIYDLGDLVQFRQRGSPTLRLDARVLAPLVGEKHLGALDFALDDEELEVGRALRDALGSLRETAPATAPDWYAELLQAVATRPKFVRSPRSVWIALGRRGVGSAAASSATLNAFPPKLPDDPGSGIDATGSGAQESESFTGGQQQVLLTNHLAGVATLAGSFARRAQLAPGIVTSLEWAGRIHDVGKADPRFQLWLHGGDEIAARFGELRLLAKSAIPWQSVVALREARKRARYPVGQRHELVSLDMIERSVPLKAQVEAEGADWELVLHLIATHHGWCRPLAPVVDMSPEDGELVPFTVNEVQLEGSTAHERDSVASGVAARFWRLNRRYGRHELAYLEAILRLADHRQSAREGDQ